VAFAVIPRYDAHMQFAQELLAEYPFTICVLVMIVSEICAERFGYTDNFTKAAQEMRKLGAGVVIITLGSKGCAVAEEKDSYMLPAFKVDAVDTTGAGDAFHGGFVFALSQGWNMKENACFASAVSALKCTRLGGRAGLPTLLQVQQFMETYKEIE